MATAVAKERIRRIRELPLERVGRTPGLLRGTASSVRAIWERRELVWLLSRREIKARYSDSSLGLAWSLVRPLAQLLIYYFAIGKVLGAARSIPDFGLFVFIGLTAWTFFTEVVTKSTSSIIENHGLVKKVYLPREIFPLSGAGSAIFTLGIQFVVLLAACAVFNRFPPLAGVGYVVLGIAILTAVGIGVGLITAAVNVYLRDVEHIVEVLLIVFFWASPIVYSFGFVRHALGGGFFELAYLSNPVTLAVMCMQRGLWVGGMDDPVAGVSAENLVPLSIVALVGGLIFLWLAQRLFARLQGNFAQEL